MAKKSKRETLSMVFGESLSHEIIHEWLKDGGYILPSGRRSGIARLIESALMLTRAYQKGLVSINATPYIKDKDVAMLAALGVNLHQQQNVDVRAKNDVSDVEKPHAPVDVVEDKQKINTDANLIAMNNALPEWR